MGLSCLSESSLVKIIAEANVPSMNNDPDEFPSTQQSKLFANLVKVASLASERAKYFGDTRRGNDDGAGQQLEELSTHLQYAAAEVLKRAGKKNATTLLRTDEGKEALLEALNFAHALFNVCPELRDFVNDEWNGPYICMMITGDYPDSVSSDEKSHKSLSYSEGIVASLLFPIFVLLQLVLLPVIAACPPIEDLLKRTLAWLWFVANEKISLPFHKVAKDLKKEMDDLNKTVKDLEKDLDKRPNKIKRWKMLKKVVDEVDDEMEDELKDKHEEVAKKKELEKKLEQKVVDSFSHIYIISAPVIKFVLKVIFELVIAVLVTITPVATMGDNTNGWWLIFIWSVGGILNEVKELLQAPMVYISDPFNGACAPIHVRTQCFLLVWQLACTQSPPFLSDAHPSLRVRSAHLRRSIRGTWLCPGNDCNVWACGSC